MANYKLGSLFDGSGGFPLAGSLCGIEPRWAAEVEPYPIAVTRKRFPRMKHLGDITKVNGAEIEPVDIITFGSPCQDLSVAGKQAGLKHTDNGDEETTRSGLFMEAVRIIKEMRQATNGKYPSFALWENVPGAFSSNKGEDFRTVLEELIHIVEPSAVVPSVPKNGWPYADCYLGDGWSLAYRVLDAQFWGVPQRRRRIYLVLDIGGERAHDILFEREGLRGYFAEGRTPWQDAPADAERGAGADDREGEGFDGYNGDLTGDKVSTLGVNCGVSTGRNGIIERRGLDDLILDDQGGQQISVRTDGKSPTLRAETHGNLPCVMDAVGIDLYNQATTGDKAISIRCRGDNEHTPCVVYPTYCLQGNGIDRADTAGCNGKGWRENESYTLNTIDRPAVVYAMDRASFNQGENAKYDPKITDSGVNSTLVSRGPSAVAYSIENHPNDSRVRVDETGKVQSLTSRMGTGGGNVPMVMGETGQHQYIVRRLTPTECARLQGFPDRWGDIGEVKEFTEEEFRFWLEVRKTFDRINERAEKDYTEKQVLMWRNSLHTDSAEYKMWGNGIALPTALYCLQGIAEALEAQAEDPDDWMN